MTGNAAGINVPLALNRSQESGVSAVTGNTGMGHQASSTSLVLHEAIIDLYLQVKVRSNDEVSHIRWINTLGNHYDNRRILIFTKVKYNLTDLKHFDHLP